MTFKAFKTPLSFAVIAMLAACGGASDEAEDAGAAATAAPAEAASPAAEIIAARQAGFKKLGGAFKTMSDQLRSGAPDVSILQTAAASVPEITSGIETWFPAGSGPEAGVKTDALPAIWEKPEEFAEKVGNFKAAAAALAAAGQTGDVTAITAAFRTTGGTCKACHDTFRLDD